MDNGFSSPSCKCGRGRRMQDARSVAEARTMYHPKSVLRTVRGCVFPSLTVRAGVLYILSRYAYDPPTLLNFSHIHSFHTVSCFLAS